MRLVSQVRQFTTDFYQEVVGDAEALSRLGVATHELIENAVRNSADGVTRLRIEYEPKVRCITIRTWNKSNAENLKTLEQRVRDMTAATDLTRFYQQLLKESSKRTQGSGLGLGRVRVEAGFTVSLAVEGQMVSVVAEGTIESPPA